MTVQHLIHWLRVDTKPVEEIERLEDLGKASFTREWRDRQLHDDEQPEEKENAES